MVFLPRERELLPSFIKTGSRQEGVCQGRRDLGPLGSRWRGPCHDHIPHRCGARGGALAWPCAPQLRRTLPACCACLGRRERGDDREAVFLLKNISSSTQRTRSRKFGCSQWFLMAVWMKETEYHPYNFLLKEQIPGVQGNEFKSVLELESPPLQ